MNLVLSLFPGIGMLDSAFELEGFCVARGPDVIWGGDIRTFHPPAGKFDGVIGGPPCQMFSSLAHLVRANGHEPKFGNLIPEFERCVCEAEPAWFLMENVRAAPEPVVPGYGIRSFLLDNSALDSGDGHGQEQTRLRRFTFGLRGKAEAPDLRRWIDMAVFFLPDAASGVTQWTPDNSQEAKAVFKSWPGPCPDCGAKPGEFHAGHCPGPHSPETDAALYAERVKHEALSGGHGVPPSVRDRVRRQAVVSDPSAVPVKIGGSGKVKRTAVSGSNGGAGGYKKRPGQGNNGKGRYRLADACRLQGLPEDFLKDAPFTAEGKLKAVANGVPRYMGVAIARAVKEATS